MVSIIVPIYNMKEHLERCIDSILSQTYTDLEIILVDDGSRDGSLKVCREYEKKDSRIHVIAKENGGVSTARNAGIDMAKGEWIMFVDPDDYLKSDIVETLLFHSHNADIVSCCCMAEQKKDNETKRTDVSFFPNNSIFSSDGKTTVKGYTSEAKIELLRQLFDSKYPTSDERITAIGVPWGKLYKACLLDMHSLRFDPLLVRLQDNVFNMFAFEAANYVVYINEPMYVYNVEHIKTFGRRYDPRTREYLDRVLTIRKKFCEKNHYFTDTVVKAAFDNEVAKYSNTILKRDFLHIDNKKGITDKAKEIQKFFSRELYQDVFRSKNLNGISMGQKVRINLIKCNLIYPLIWMETIRQRIRL